MFNIAFLNLFLKYDLNMYICICLSIKQAFNRLDFFRSRLSTRNENTTKFKEKGQSKLKHMSNTYEDTHMKETSKLK